MKAARRCEPYCAQGGPFFQKTRREGVAEAQLSDREQQTLDVWPRPSLQTIAVQMGISLARFALIRTHLREASWAHPARRRGEIFATIAAVNAPHCAAGIKEGDPGACCLIVK